MSVELPPFIKRPVRELRQRKVADYMLAVGQRRLWRYLHDGTMARQHAYISRPYRPIPHVLYANSSARRFTLLERLFAAVLRA